MCKDCAYWKICPNIELGDCTLVAKKKTTTWYNSKCLFGLTESIEPPEIKTKTVSYNSKVKSKIHKCWDCGASGKLFIREIYTKHEKPKILKVNKFVKVKHEKYCTWKSSVTTFLDCLIDGEYFLHPFEKWQAKEKK